MPNNQNPSRKQQQQQQTAKLSGKPTKTTKQKNGNKCIVDFLKVGFLHENFPPLFMFAFWFLGFFVLFFVFKTPGETRVLCGFDFLLSNRKVSTGI